MSGQALFSRKRGTSSEPPPDDPEKAPYGWMKDRKTGKWRPRKTWGGAGRGAHKVAGQPPTNEGPARPAAKRPARKKTAARPTRTKPLQMVEPLPEDDTEPASEEEFLPFLGADPEPSWHTDDPTPVLSSADEGKVDLRTEVESWIALGWSIPADILSSIDPYCFNPLSDDETGPLIVGCLADIAMQSPKVAAFIASKSGLMPYIKLGFAFKPVVKNMWSHHVSKKVEVEIDREAGMFTVRQRDYSQYPAA